MASLSNASTTGSNITTSNGLSYMFTCTLTATIIKLNGDNYMLWSQSFHAFVRAQREIGHLLMDHQIEGSLLF